MSEADIDRETSSDRGARSGADPEAPSDPGGPPGDATLGGYFSVHERPPAFEGADGRPYTVSVETEQLGDLTRPFAAYLVFPRWTHDGSAVEGHVQTPLLARGRSRGEVEEEVGRLTLLRVKELLDEAIHRGWEEDGRPEEGRPEDGSEGRP